MISITYQLNCIFAGNDLLGESPIWHQQEKKLYWVDAIKPALHALCPYSGEHQQWKMPALIGSIAPRKRGGLIAAIGCGIAFIDLPSGKVSMQKLINPPLCNKHLNDGKCDRQGRFWVGEVSHDKTKPNGKIYRFDGDGSLHIMQENIALFNGPCWSPNNDYFYYTDSFNERRVFRYIFEAQKGTIKNGEVFIQMAADNVMPDGCTVDSEGYLWSAKWDGHRISRYDPEGNLVMEIPIPTQRPTSCIFGGEDLDTLFVTSASQDVSELKPLDDQNAGNVFSIKFAKLRGIAETPFLG